MMCLYGRQAEEKLVDQERAMSSMESALQCSRDRELHLEKELEVNLQQTAEASKREAKAAQKAEEALSKQERLMELSKSEIEALKDGEVWIQQR